MAVATSAEQKRRAYEKTLRELTMINFQVLADTACGNIVRRLEDDPSLCGVVVVDDDDALLGMLPRRSVLEWMLSTPYGMDVFRKKPVSAILEFRPREYLCLEGDLTVVEAAAKAFERSEEYIYDPVVVKLADDDYQLLDVPVLLVAQAQVQLGTQQRLQEEQGKLRRVLAALHGERQKSQQYVKALEQQQAQILHQNEALQQERRTAQARSEELAQLNQRIIEIASVFSAQGRHSFEATFEGVAATRSIADNFSDVSRQLSEELREIAEITDLILEVAGFIRLLSFNAAVDANRSNSNPGISTLSGEIRKLASRTTEASTRIKGIVDRIQKQTELSVEAAANANDVVASLSTRAQDARQSLSQLEALLAEVSL